MKERERERERTLKDVHVAIMKFRLELNIRRRLLAMKIREQIEDNIFIICLRCCHVASCFCFALDSSTASNDLYIKQYRYAKVPS